MNNKNELCFESLQQMQLYAKQNHLDLVVYKNVIYDISSFFIHPGSYRVLRQYSNSDITNTFTNIPEHQNNIKQIIWKLNQFRFGYISKDTKPITIYSESHSQIEIVRKFLLLESDSKNSTLAMNKRNVYTEEKAQQVPKFIVRARTLELKSIKKINI